MLQLFAACRKKDDESARRCVRSVMCQAWKKSMQHAAMDALQHVLEQPKAAVVETECRFAFGHAFEL